MKYKIIIIAMKDELKPIKNQLKVNEKGDYQTGNTIIKISKIGKVNAAYTVTKSIYEYGKNNIKEIINIGTAGSINEPIGTIIKGSKYIYGDVDVTPFNYQLGQVPEMPEYYGKEGNLIITTDSFVTNIDNLKLSTEIKNKITAIEMEATAIAQVCYLEDIKFSTYKVISDNANHKADKDFKGNIHLVMKELLAKIIGG
jgi:adenosylhomocysteine nucleosidase